MAWCSPTKIWFAPEYPLAGVGTGKPRDWGDKYTRLRDDIAARGLVNPLIVLNHERPGFARNWVMTGRNKLTAVKELGWITAPAIVTGECDVFCVPVEWEEIGFYFPDASEVYWGNHGPRLRGYSDFTKGEMPSA